jgi:dTMP kinase
MIQQQKDLSLERRGFWLVVEGCDGVGKTTQLNRLAASLDRSHVSFLRVRVPGQTYYGQKIRELLLSPAENANLTGRDEMMLMLADRMLLLENVVYPALQQNMIVLQDRYTPSMYLYQGTLKGVPFKTIEYFVKHLHIPEPDAYIHLDVISPQIDAFRTRLLERADLTHHDRAIIKDARELVDLYRSIMMDPACIGQAAVGHIDAMLPEEQVTERIEQYLNTLPQFREVASAPTNAKIWHSF